MSPCLNKIGILVLAAAVAACGGTMKNKDGDSDALPDITVELPDDVTPDGTSDVAPDGASDVDEEEAPPHVECTTHEDCLPDSYCGPCTYTRCPCDPESFGCDPYCIENPCWDGTSVTCTDTPPTCPLHEVLTVHEGCYRCVDVATCRSWSDIGCLEDGHCPPSYYCDPCAHPSCPDCDDCIQDCSSHGCPTEAELTTCADPRPDCGEGNVGVIRSGCWVCVSMETCLEV
jgi:hypothetical protein